MKRRLFLQTAGAVGLSGLTLPSVVWGASPQAEQVQAWTGATLWSGDGSVHDNCLVVVRGDRIVSAGPAGPIPEGAEVHDARGLTLTPGWIACETALGLVEIEAEPSTVDSTAGKGTLSERIRAAHSAADGFNSRSSLLAVALRGGVTNAVSTPSGGLVSGTSCWSDLLAPQALLRSKPLVREHIALHADIFSTDWGSRPRGLSLLRQALENARLYARAPRAYDQGRTRVLGGLSPAILARLAESFDGRPLVVRVSRAADIVRLLSLAEEYSLRLILSGAEEGALVAEKIAANGAAVVLNVLDNLPTTFASLYSRSDNATLLRKAGVSVIFSSFDAHQVHILSQIAGNAVAAGMSRQDALNALCYEPAQAFGMAKDYGSVSPGKVANFCLWTGEPFALSSWVKTVVVRGRASTPYSRQDALFQRYRDLNNIPRGRSGLPRS